MLFLGRGIAILDVESFLLKLNDDVETHVGPSKSLALSGLATDLLFVAIVVAHRAGADDPECEPDVYLKPPQVLSRRPWICHRGPRDSISWNWRWMDIGLRPGW